MHLRLVVSLLALLISTTALAGVLQVRVVAVTDGDTIKILDAANVQHVIRLAGIDAPEKNMPFGQRSKQNLSGLVYGKEAIVEGEKDDRYGRLVGKVMVNGIDANLAQIRAGIAWHYKQYQREQSAEDRQAYSAVEDAAKSNKLGLWADVDPVQPWVWRADRKNHH